MIKEQAVFGAGLLWGTPTADASGNPISNGTPVLFGTLQDVSVDISYDMKELHGSDGAFAKFVGRGKGKIDCQATMGTIKGAVFSSLFFGQSASSGLIGVNYDTVGTTLAGTSVSVTPPNAGTFQRDLGVINRSTGVALTKVASAPVAGQYSVNAGTYTFASADSGNVVLINYEYTATVANSNHSTVANLPMGYAPTFSCELFNPYQGKSLVLTLNNCIASKLTMATKLDDFMMPQFAFSAFADEFGNVLSYSLSV